MLPIHVSDTDATSQDGSSLELVSATTRRECYIQDARSRGLCLASKYFLKLGVSLGAISAHLEIRRCILDKLFGKPFALTF